MLTRKLGEPARNENGDPLCSFDGLTAHSPLETARKTQRELEAHAERQRLERADDRVPRLVHGHVKLVLRHRLLESLH